MHQSYVFKNICRQGTFLFIPYLFLKYIKTISPTEASGSWVAMEQEYYFKVQMTAKCKL